jgi:beta-1,4-mannosyltransferase
MFTVTVHPSGFPLQSQLIEHQVVTTKVTVNSHIDRCIHHPPPLSLSIIVIMHIIVIVLGDLGRSPRMQYHCQSLLDAGHSVTAVGYHGEACSLLPSAAANDSNNNSRLQIIRFSVPVLFQSVHPLLYFIWRIISLTVYLLYALFVSVQNSRPVDFVLVQNPPALPLLAVAYFFCKVKGLTQGRRPGLVIDWHNLGYSMLRDGSMVQKIAALYERRMAPLADGHLAVTAAMKEFLEKEMKVSTKNIEVLYDCPPDMFQPLDAIEQHQVLLKLDSELRTVCPASWLVNDTKGVNQTLFTEILSSGNTCRHRPGRPALVTSSTSWTSDEDFGILLGALVQLDETISNNNQDNVDSSFRVMVIVTGKGPEREVYEEQISRMKLVHVGIATVWLEAEDYPKLLACADVGVSLHTSTSGLDLPMKILDLFGCQVPVLAYNFDCLHELVQDNVNGRVFRTSNELASLLYELLKPLGAGNSPSMANHSFGALVTYSKQLEGRKRWNENWNEHAFPVLLRSTPR